MMKNTLFIRPAIANDKERVIELLADLDYLVRSGEEFEKLWRRIALEDPAWGVFMALRSGSCVGFVSVHARPVLRLEGFMASIEELVVRKESRGSGVGAALLDKAVSFAYERGCVRIEVLSSTRRESYRRRFYENHGFGEHPSAVFRINRE